MINKRKKCCILLVVYIVVKLHLILTEENVVSFYRNVFDAIICF